MINVAAGAVWIASTRTSGRVASLENVTGFPTTILAGRRRRLEHGYGGGFRGGFLAVFKHGLLLSRDDEPARAALPSIRRRPFHIDLAKLHCRPAALPTAMGFDRLTGHNELILHGRINF